MKMTGRRYQPELSMLTSRGRLPASSTADSTRPLVCSEPALAAEEPIQANGNCDNQNNGDDEAPGPSGAGVGDVHPVVAGDEGGHGDDRRPAADLLHHLVLAVVPEAEVGLDDGATRSRSDRWTR